MKNKQNFWVPFRKILVVLIGLLFTSAMAQTRVSGKVMDDTGIPMAGVSIVVAGTTQGTQTDFDGNFSLEVNRGDVLEISYIGMQSVTVTIDSFDPINVVLSTDTAVLDEVVVVGYGSRKKADLIGSVAVVDPESMTKVATADIGEMLRGQAAGVRISLNDSGPGSSSNIVIRGQSSINAGNSPLVIVDGVPFDVAGINNINPNDIESLNVLKDAASLAIYGARASNGVILITTKRGAKGEAKIEYNGSSGLQTINRNFDIYSGDEFVALKMEAFRTANGGMLPELGSILSAEQIESINTGQYIDWEDYILRAGVVHNHNLSISSGNDKFSIYSGFQFFNQEGVIINTDYNRMTGRINIDQQVKDWWKIGANVNLNYSKERGPSTGGVLLRAISTSPLGQVYNEDGTFKLEPEGVEENKNPLIDLYETANNRDNANTLFNVFSDLTLAKGFKYRLNLSRRSWDGKVTYYQTANSVGGITDGYGSGNIQYYNQVEWQVENILTYNTDFNGSRSNFDFTGVHSVVERKNDNYRVDAIGFSNDILGIKGIEAAESAISRVSGDRYGLLSFVGRAEYSYDSKYYLSASMRADASSIFGANNKWGYFPAVGLSWNAHNENFLKDVSSVNLLKLSMSYGQVGNQGVGPYQSLALATQRDYFFDADDDYFAGFTPSSRLPNPDLKWETKTTFNAKVDFGLFGRLNGTVEYYKENSTDLLFNINPDNPSYTSFRANLGEVQNQGLEITLSGDAVRNDDMRINLGLTFTRNRNEVISLTGKDEDGDGIEDDLPANNLFIGQPISVIYRAKAIGIWQEGEDIVNSNMPDARPGEYKLLDYDGDGIVEPGSDDRVITPTVEDWYGSGFINASYKGFDLSANLLVVAGLKRDNPFLYGYNEGGSLRGIKNGIKVDYWTPENPTAPYTRPNEANDPPFLSSNAIQDASYFRIQNLTVGYSFPDRLTKGMGLNKLRLYLTGSNILTVTDFQSFSPEKNPSDYPEPVTVVAGIQVSL